MMVKSILAGIAIGIGCIANLSVENKYIGAFLFSIGLITICSRGWNLYTGKICVGYYKIGKILRIWIGNFIGILISCIAYKLTVRTDEELNKLIVIAQNKLNKPTLSVFAASVICEICIFIAVVGYREIKSDIGKYLSVILGVMVFILAGAEHSIADMFYMVTYSFFNMSVSTFLKCASFILIVTIWNYIGASIMKVLEMNSD